jgi:hypothetical protein
MGYCSPELACAYILSDLAVDLQASKIRHARRDAGRERLNVCRMNAKKPWR